VSISDRLKKFAQV